MDRFVPFADSTAYERMVRHVHQRGRTLKQSEIGRFAALGVNVLNLHIPWPVLADRVVFDGGYFEFAHKISGTEELAFTSAVIGDYGIVDVVARHPTGDRLATWLGTGFALSERQINNPIPGVFGLRVFRSPMDWLRAGRQGIVILQRVLRATGARKCPVVDRRRRRASS